MLQSMGSQVKHHLVTEQQRVLSRVRIFSLPKIPLRAQQVALWPLHTLFTEMAGGGRREEGSGWGTHVYLWRIHFDIWQN